VAWDVYNGKGENIEKMFNLEIQDKKRISKSARCRAERKGPKGGSVRFPNDHKTKREVRLMSGEATAGIMPKKEFYALPSDKRVLFMKNMLEYYSQKQIAEAWRVGTGSVSFQVCKLGLSDRSKKFKPEDIEVEIKKDTPKIDTAPQNTEPVGSSLTISFSGKFNGGDITDRLMKIADLLQSEKEYVMDFRMIEKFA
jgi:hypothetical protein